MNATTANNNSATSPVLQSAAATMNPLRYTSSGRGLLVLNHAPKQQRTTGSSSSSSGTFHSAVAGYVAGVSGTVVGYPLDSAKVWIQTGGCKNKHMIMASSGATAVGAGGGGSLVPSRPSRPLVTAWQTLRALYSGVAGPLVTVGMVQGLNFAVYDRTRQFLHSKRTQQQQQNQQHHKYKGVQAPMNVSYLSEDSLSGVATAGFVSGMTIACITAPLVMIKTNQQITGNSFRQALHDSLYRHGRLNVSGGAAGFLPHVIGESVGRSIYYFTYEALKRSWAAGKSGDVASSSNNSTAAISLQERMACAAVSGMVCWAAIFPLDSLRSRLYAAAATASQRVDGLHPFISSKRSLVDTFRQMRQERSFYRGFWLTVLRAGPVAAVVLPVYDLTLETLSCRSPQ